MFFKKNNASGYSTKILVAPLDWGLGHATRCIPIIKHLLNSGATVVVAADEKIRALLQQEFPEVEFLNLPGYNIRYSQGQRQGAALFFQLPKLIMAVYAEKKWLKKMLRQQHFDAVISDNRLGFYSKDVPCVYITHQLAIKTGNRFTDWVAQKIHYSFINKYSECWVPDEEGADCLAGDLSHPLKRPHTAVSYLGILSRFEKTLIEKKYELVILLSGPESQRTIFENILCKQLIAFNKKVLFVRGLPRNNQELSIPNKNIEVHNHLSAANLNNAMLQSNVVISRSGYTTIMDLITLQQKAVLVPTPGQTEQEYLSRYVLAKKIFYSVPQKDFVLTDALIAANSFSYSFIATDNNIYKKIIDGFLQKLITSQGIYNL
jgi:uncharacterized protein (TIGR00661 family)